MGNYLIKSMAKRRSAINYSSILVIFLLIALIVGVFITLKATQTETRTESQAGLNPVTIVNADFEQWDKDLPVHWISSQGTISRSKEKYDGTYGVLLEGDKTNLFYGQKALKLTKANYNFIIRAKANRGSYTFAIGKLGRGGRWEIVKKVGGPYTSPTTPGEWARLATGITPLEDGDYTIGVCAWSVGDLRHEIYFDSLVARTDSGTISESNTNVNVNQITYCEFGPKLFAV